MALSTNPFFLDNGRFHSDSSLMHLTDSSYRSWFCFGSLPLSRGQHIEAGINHIYVYRHLGLVVKIHGDESTFAQELYAYELCKDPQGDAIPILYGSGILPYSRLRFLVVSYGGECIEELDHKLACVNSLFLSRAALTRPQQPPNLARTPFETSQKGPSSRPLGGKHCCRSGRKADAHRFGQLCTERPVYGGPVPRSRVVE